MDEVPAHQEIIRKAHRRHDTELIVEPFGHVGGNGRPVAFLCSLICQVAQVLVRALEAFGQREGGQLRFPELNIHIGALRHPQRVVASVRVVGKKPAHLRRRFEVVLRTLEAETLGVVHARARLHAQQRVVRQMVLTSGVVTVIGRQ